MSTLKDSVDAYEKQLVESCLVRHAGNRSHAAIELGISRRGLLNLIERHGINIPAEARYLRKVPSDLFEGDGPY